MGTESDIPEVRQGWDLPSGYDRVPPTLGIAFDALPQEGDVPSDDDRSENDFYRGVGPEAKPLLEGAWGELGTLLDSRRTSALNSFMGYSHLEADEYTEHDGWRRNPKAQSPSGLYLPDVVLDRFSQRVAKLQAEDSVIPTGFNLENMLARAYEECGIPVSKSRPGWRADLALPAAEGAIDAPFMAASGAGLNASVSVQLKSESLRDTFERDQRSLPERGALRHFAKVFRTLARMEGHYEGVLAGIRQREDTEAARIAVSTALMNHMDGFRSVLQMRARPHENGNPDLMSYDLVELDHGQMVKEFLLADWTPAAFHKDGRVTSWNVNVGGNFTVRLEVGSGENVNLSFHDIDWDRYQIRHASIDAVRAGNQIVQPTGEVGEIDHEEDPQLSFSTIFTSNRYVTDEQRARALVGLLARFPDELMPLGSGSNDEAIRTRIEMVLVPFPDLLQRYADLQEKHEREFAQRSPALGMDL